MSTRVTYTFDAGLARITLTDPDRGNSMYAESVAELYAAVSRAGDDRARVILLAATGRFFNAGGDLAVLAASDDPGTYIEGLAGALHQVVLALTRSPAIVVAVVQGAAAGAGFPLAAAADLVLAARSARFSLGHLRVGLSVDGGAGLLVHSLGLHRTLRLALLTDTLTADEAVTLGLVARVEDDDLLTETAEDVVRQLLHGSATANAATKKLIRDAADAAPERTLRAEQISIGERAAAADGREGVAAFMSKRTPGFG